jgi:hypothetical protein
MCHGEGRVGWCGRGAEDMGYRPLRQANRLWVPQGQGTRQEEAHFHARPIHKHNPMRQWSPCLPRRHYRSLACRYASSVLHQQRFYQYAMVMW